MSDSYRDNSIFRNKVCHDYLKSDIIGLCEYRFAINDIQTLFINQVKVTPFFGGCIVAAKILGI